MMDRDVDRALAVLKTGPFDVWITGRQGTRERVQAMEDLQVLAGGRILASRPLFRLGGGPPVRFFFPEEIEAPESYAIRFSDSSGDRWEFELLVPSASEEEARVLAVWASEVAAHPDDLRAIDARGDVMIEEAVKRAG